MAVAVTAGALLVSAAVVGAAPHAWGVLHAHEEVPVRLPGAFSGLATRSRIMDVSGTQIGVFEFENSQPLAIEAVPDHVIAAVLAVEDQGFERHKGVNLRALVRAALANFQYTTARQGASTITQQVVKNEFLAGLPRDGRYKILQARYAAMLEKSVPKEKIVERYLNTVFFGNNAYGIQAAAETYFGTRVADLTLAQAGFLAGLVRAPSTYDPIRRPEQARRRFAQVLERLVETSLMTRAEADTTLAGFPIPEKASAVSRQSTSRTYISEMIRDYLLNKSTVLGATYADRYAALYRGGLTITTTIDADDQKKAEKAALEKLPANKTGIQSAVVSLDTATGAVRRQAQSAANSALANAPSGVVIDVDESDFQQKVIDASNQVPVVVDLWAEWCGPCKQLSPVLEKIAAEFNGKFILAKVDIDKNQNIAAAFQVQSIPAVFAIIAGSAAPLFQGAMPEAQVRQVLTEVIRIANEQGVKGTVAQDQTEEQPEVQTEEPKTDPKLESAFNAIEKGDFGQAKTIYQEMLNQNPKDEMAIAGLAQVGLLERSTTLNENEIRKNASDKKNVDAQLQLADLELMKGNPEAGFNALIAAIKITSGQDRDKLRERLLELFVVVGDNDPHVLKARRDLASALF